MFEVFIKILPGLAISSAIFLAILAIVQGKIYRARGYQRSKYLMIFCTLSVGESLTHFVSHSRLFSEYWTLMVTHIGVFCIFTAGIYYMKSLSFFIAIPNWLFKFYTGTFKALSLMAFAFFLHFLFTGKTLYYDSENLVTIGNYFVDSYQARLGMSTWAVTYPLGIAAVTILIGATVMLSRVLRSLQDIYFIFGLALSIVSALRENILLPITVEYYVPAVFMANLFEAFRMNALSYGEYMRSVVDHHRLSQKEEKYQNSNLSEERVAELAVELKSLLEQEKLFFKPNLSSEELAKALRIPTYQLSQVINIGLNTTFFELMSRYRIDEVKKHLQDKEFENETIINIAYRCGFNSKSAFNTSFKKITGLTPSQYRKESSQSPANL